MENKILSGNLAIAYAMKQINPDVVAAFPITPSTEIPEKFSTYVAKGEVATHFINVESEHSAMSACIGASLAGARTMTATSSNGLAYMWEMLHIASSLRSSVVMSLVNRSISAPLNIHNDHSDAMGMRETGWIMLFSENNQEAYDNFLIGTKLAEHKDVLLPVAICQDGFITSHSLENMEVLEDDKVKKFVGEYLRENNLLDKKNPITIGALDMPTFLFEHKISQLKGLKNAKNILKEIDEEYFKISGKKYSFFEEYKTEDAEYILIAMNSTVGIMKDIVDELRKNGEKVGVIKIRLYRPFPDEELVNTLIKNKKLKGIAIYDKFESLNNIGSPLYQDISSALYAQNIFIPALNFVYGIGGRDIKKEEIINSFEQLKEYTNGNNDKKIYRFIGLRGEI